MNRGFLATLTAFLIWGMVPVYFKWLAAVPSLQIVAHRALWCCCFAFLALAAGRRVNAVRAVLRDRRTLGLLGASALLIAANWLLYVWAVTHDHVVEASLGYFINPLVNIVLGVTLLGERLTAIRWAAIALAVVGVFWLGFTAGAPPWIALGLAAAFGFYGLIRKTAPVEAVAGLATETLLLSPLALGFLFVEGAAGTGAFGHGSWRLDFLLIGSGLLTAVPLMLFAYGARRIRYSTVGLIQYLQPSMQLLLGVALYHEPFGRSELLGFCAIWGALGLCTVEVLIAAGRASRTLSLRPAVPAQTRGGAPGGGADPRLRA